MRILLARNLTIAASLALSGCIAFPIAVPEEKPFRELVEDYFVAGETTAADVIDKLGEPAVREERRWMYRRSREGWQWAFCAGAYYSAGCGAIPRSSTDYFLIVDLDDNDVTTDIKLYSETELCAELKICIEGYIEMRAVPAEQDALAKQFRAAPLGCKVFTYSTTSSDSTAGELSIDSNHVGGLVGTSGFYLHTVAPGPHAWVVAPAQNPSLPYPIARFKFDCEGQQVAYLRYSNGLWFNKIRSVDADTGQKDIRQRWLAESTTAPDKLISADPNSVNWLRGGQIYVSRQDNSVSAYQLVESDKVPRWGRSESGEPCGMRAALEDYGLAPVGGETDLQFVESLNSFVQLRAVCNASSECSFASVIDHESCEATPGTAIAFDSRSKLLLLEADGESYTELFYGSAKSLKNQANCDKHNCEIDVSQLRDVGPAE